MQHSHFEEATYIIYEMSGGKRPGEKIFVNVVDSVDGAENFDGRPMTNAEIGAAIAKG